MVVIGIVGTLLAIAVPAYASWRQSSALDSAGNALIMHLKQARHLSIAENRSVIVQIASAQWIFDQDMNGVGAPYRNQTVRMAQFGNVTVTVSTFLNNNNNGVIRFSSRGILSGVGGTITMSAGNRTKTITINQVGRAYIQ